MYEKKYEEYLIKVTYENGDVENIKYKGVNTSDWKQMMSIYRDVKEEYNNIDCQIDFMDYVKNTRDFSHRMN